MMEDADTMMDSLIREMEAAKTAYIEVAEIQKVIGELHACSHLPAPLVADMLEHIINEKKVML